MGTYAVLDTSAYLFGFMIRRAENLESAYFKTFANEKPKHVTPKFVFRRYGSQYFLAEILTGGTTGRELPKSSKELQLIYIAAK